MTTKQLIKRLQELPADYEVDIIDEDSSDHVTDIRVVLDHKYRRISLNGKSYDDEREGDWVVDAHGADNECKLPKGVVFTGVKLL